MENAELREAMIQVELTRKRLLQPLFLDLGLTLGQGQPRILSHLLQQEGITQKELADLCHMDVTTLSRTLDHMERAELLLRQRDPDCRRSFQIVLTEKGRQTARRVREIFHRLDHRILSALEPEEARAMITALQKIACALEQGLDPEPSAG